MQRTMNRALALALASTLIGGFGAGTAFAQVADPDIRNIRPVVMLLVDTSGSMERLPGGADAPLPVCTGGVALPSQRNRWTSVLEALTGTWSDSDYYCTTVNRNVFSGSPDFNYYLPYHRPPPSTDQNNDGVLDVYIDRIKFGLMTYDSVYTFTDTHPLLYPRTSFSLRMTDNASSQGGYSYGDARPLTYPGCSTTFMVDSGARNDSAPNGALISVGTELDDPTIINQNIQTQLLGVRPFGGTPTASLLHDYRYYLANHPDVTSDDPFRTCRTRFAVLLTDGQPDEDFRDARFNCDALAPSGCPYQRSRDIAEELCDYNGTSGTCSGDLDGVFVVAFDVSDPAALAELDSIAVAGGTTAALRATDRDELMRRLSEVLDATAPGNTTRSRPSFVTGSSTFNATGAPKQYEFNAGFRVGVGGGPWAGILERTAFICDDSSPDPLTPVQEPVERRVRFDAKLNTQSTRRLLTVRTPDPADLDNNLVGTDALAVPLGATLMAGAVTNQSLTEFNSSIAPAYFGISTGSATTQADRRNAIVNWVYGTTPDRQDPACWGDRTRWDEGCASRMGDIYHSSPVAVGPPRVDIADESYNLFRRQIADRPTVVYVGTNDGVLHAFAAEDWQCPPGLPPGGRLRCSAGDRYEAGEEIWGFVPPILLPKLESATNSHQILLDGTPVVRDIFYRRLPEDTPNGGIYHTVLVMGFRGGATGYFAMDVTDPMNPSFLWQFVGEQATGGGAAGRRTTPLGYSYGVPAIGQVLVDIGGVLQERAIALLPGGSGTVDGERARTTGPVGCPAQGVGMPPNNEGVLNARSRQRCWNNVGRIVTWVDIVTGEVINSFDEGTFGAPVTGGVALYPGDVGTTAERAFFTDADGVLWTADFTSRNPADWSVRQVYDLFVGAGATEGQPAYNPPIVSTDEEGNLVILQATGDIDRLDGTAENRVVSLTERRAFSGGSISYTADLNWLLPLRPGEQVTGAPELFEGRVFFATFESGVAADACNIGQSRIWALEYRESTTDVAPGYSAPVEFPAPAFESTPGLGYYDQHYLGPYDQRLVLGVGVTQRPTCVQGGEEFDPFIGQRYRVNTTGGGEFVLTAQMSGGTGTSGGAIQTITQVLQAPPSYTTVSAFAGQVDY